MVKLEENDRVAFEAYQDRSIAKDGNIFYSGVDLDKVSLCFGKIMDYF